VLLLAAAIGLAAALSLVAILVPQSAEANRSPIRKAQVSRQSQRAQQVSAAELRTTLAGIHAKRDETWKWDDVMSTSRVRYAGLAEQSHNVQYRRSVLTFWTQLASKTQWQAQHPPRLKDWLCIHHYEGAWNDPSPPYWGGLQMDMTFQREYGAALLRRKGTADHWTPLEQIWVAERAYRSGRGFYPWPNTARWCGLI
jgi:hypothetical protein